MAVLRQLPRWAWIGGGVLAFIAGIVNAAGYLGFRHQAITNLTGSTTLLGASLGLADGPEAVHWGLSVAAFVFGALLSGLIVQQQTLKLGRRYGVALVLESLLLFAAIPLFLRQQIAGALLAAMACGLQNAMATTFSGAAIRTSHLSGMFTDLGIGVGHALRGMPLQKRRLLLCVLIIAGFFCGAVLGALLFARLGYLALAVPATATGLTGLGYAACRHLQLRQSPAAGD